MKIGRHEYEIIKGDKFLDNGSCVQLLTQSKETSTWGHTPNPVLSKKAVKELKKMDYEKSNFADTEDIFVYTIKASSWTSNQESTA